MHHCWRRCETLLSLWLQLLLRALPTTRLDTLRPPTRVSRGTLLAAAVYAAFGAPYGVAAMGCRTQHAPAASAREGSDFKLADLRRDEFRVPVGARARRQCTGGGVAGTQYF